MDNRPSGESIGDRDRMEDQAAAPPVPSHPLLKLPPHFKPAIGACLSAVVGLLLFAVLDGEQRVLAVLSFGYGILQEALTSPSAEKASLWFALVLLAVALGKILTTGLTIGSSGSGGVFGPSMVIGGCGGGALG